MHEYDVAFKLVLPSVDLTIRELVVTPFVRSLNGELPEIQNMVSWRPAAFYRMETYSDHTGCRYSVSVRRVMHSSSAKEQELGHASQQTLQQNPTAQAFYARNRGKINNPAQVGTSLLPEKAVLNSCSFP